MRVAFGSRFESGARLIYNALMGSAKPVVLALCASVGLHAALVWSMGRPWFGPQPSASNTPTDISYIVISSPKVEHGTPSKTELPAAKKKVRGIPIPRQAASAAAAKSSPALHAAPPAKMPASAAKTQAVSSAPRSSAEMMSDPVKGKIFVGYFADVKRKVQHTLLARFAHRYSGKGSVQLLFVLDPQGRAERVSVVADSTEADEMLQDMAVQCVRQSSPFGAFPSELGSRSIAFNVTIFFDGD